MRNFLFFMLALLLAACSEEADEPDVLKTDAITSSIVSMTPSEAQKEFAITLSRAATHSAKLRLFLKQQALKMYDRDYDVFYPYVKDVTIENEKTFRDLLVAQSNEATISSIESAVPLLTILIPELSFANAFSVKTWDATDPSIAVSYSNGNIYSTFYEDGDSLLSLDKSELPNFPFLVVKNNERMKIVAGHSTGTTRNSVSNLAYDFSNEAFDGSKKRPATRDSYVEEINPTPNPAAKPYLTKDELSPICIQAFKEFKRDRYHLDRDYIYYGLSKTKQKNGKLNPNVFERFYKFSVNPQEYKTITDNEDVNNEDPTVVHDRDGNLYHHDSKPDYDGIIKDLWTNGNFEFVFRFVRANRDDKVVESETKYLSVSPIDLFYIKKFNVKYRHATAFRHAKWWYSTKVENMEPKWVDVTTINNNQPIYLSSKIWDLGKESLGINIYVEEFDRSRTVTKTENFIAEFINKLSLGVSVSPKDSPLKLNAGIDATKNEKKEFSYVYNTPDTNDKLGSVTLQYDDPVISSEVGNGIYNMFTYSTGYVSLLIAPYAVR
ncbi:MAG: hypothetical protein K6A82_07900 [Prevotella sp.]|nr:hypothetical protein [Prevotella sp.]